jgi:hypothetical protein
MAEERKLIDAHREKQNTSEDGHDEKQLEM